MGRLPWEGISDARLLPLSRRRVSGSRFSWSEVVEVGVADAYLEDAAEGAVLIRAMSSTPEK